MRTKLAILALLAAAPVFAQAGRPDATRIVAGSYAADPNHTQVAWSVNHLGFNLYNGLFAGTTGTMTLDPANPAKAAVAIQIPLDKVVTTSDALTAHLKRADFFDTAKFPVATFKSTKVVVSGTTATIAGDLTLHGVTRPVTLEAHFVGAGNNPLSKAATVGFEATTSIKRSDYGMTFLVPGVGDQVDLRITVAFERK